MVNYRKIFLSVVFIFTFIFAFTSCGTPKISESDVRSGSGKYIDCSNFEKREPMQGYFGIVLSQIGFETKEEFYNFFTLQSYTKEQRTAMANFAVNDMLELPETDNMLCVKFADTENINKIEWGGGNYYTYNLSADFDGTSFAFNFRPITSVEEIENFLAKKDNDENRKKSVYWQDGVKYIKYTGTALNGADFTVYHWSVENEDNKFYVYQSMHGDIDSFWGTDFNYIRILVENSYGYQFITFENADDILVTPELVKQFTVYSQNIE